MVVIYKFRTKKIAEKFASRYLDNDDSYLVEDREVSVSFRTIEERIDYLKEIAEVYNTGWMDSHTDWVASFKEGE